MSRVLIVDDENSIRSTLCAFLRNDGYMCDTAADGIAALDLLAECTYEIVVTDIIMPRYSGMELLAWIRSRSPATQVIIMTGEPTVDTAVIAVRNGATDYLVKPINKESLLRVVGRAAHIARLEEDKRKLEAENQAYQRNLESLVSERTDALQNVMRGIVNLVSTMDEFRDPYTAGHQRRVGNLAAAIAEKMLLDVRTVDNIRIAGYIHDIGKIVVPAEILSRPGRLGELELAMVRTHPGHGFEMLRKVALPTVVRAAVHQHHERLDGSGYPQGLHGADIGMETRILSVADVVEAMMSHRPYRPALGLDASLSEIQANAGILYDREVVDTCVALFRTDAYTIDDLEHRFQFPIG